MSHQDERGGQQWPWGRGRTPPSLSGTSVDRPDFLACLQAMLKSASEAKAARELQEADMQAVKQSQVSAICENALLSSVYAFWRSDLNLYCSSS